MRCERHAHSAARSPQEGGAANEAPQVASGPFGATLPAGVAILLLAGGAFDEYFQPPPPPGSRQLRRSLGRFPSEGRWLWGSMPLGAAHEPSPRSADCAHYPGLRACSLSVDHRCSVRASRRATFEELKSHED